MVSKVKGGGTEYTHINAKMVSYTYIHWIVYAVVVKFVNYFRVIIRFIMYIHCVLACFIHKIKENCCF